MVSCSKHLKRNSFRAGMGTIFLPNKVQPQAKLNGGSKRWLILKYSFPTKTPFKLKIMCKGLTFASFAFMRRGDLKSPRTSFFPLSSLVDSWRTQKNVSFPTPLNPTRVKCNHVRTDGLWDGRNTSGKWSGDAKPWRGKGYIGDDIGLFRLSYLFTCLL